MYVCVCVCVCVYIYIYIHTHTLAREGQSIIIGKSFAFVFLLAEWGGSLFGQKPFLLKAKRSLCNDGSSALKSKGTVLKNDVIISFIFLLK